MQKSEKRVVAEDLIRTCIETIPVEAKTRLEACIVTKQVEAELLPILSNSPHFSFTGEKNKFLPFFPRRVERTLTT